MQQEVCCSFFYFCFCFHFHFHFRFYVCVCVCFFVVVVGGGGGGGNDRLGIEAYRLAKTTRAWPALVAMVVF